MCCTEQVTGFLVHMRDEHRRLRELLLKIEQNWDAVKDGDKAAPQQILGGLRELRTELVHHFAEEEEGGCLEEAACRCPSLSKDVQRVENEHVQLLEELDGVVEQLPEKAESLAILQQHAKFARFTAKLREHESAENQLLEKAFGWGVES